MVGLGFRPNSLLFRAQSYNCHAPPPSRRNDSGDWGRAVWAATGPCEALSRLPSAQLDRLGSGQPPAPPRIFTSLQGATGEVHPVPPQSRKLPERCCVFSPALYPLPTICSHFSTAPLASSHPPPSFRGANETMHVTCLVQRLVYN